METLAKESGVPVWNGLTDEWHPTQMIADFMTLKAHFKTLKQLTLTYLGDAKNNVAHSLLITGALLGVNIHIGALSHGNRKKKLSKKLKPSLKLLAVNC